MKEKRRNFVREEFQLLNEGEREKCLRYWDIGYSYRGKILMFLCLLTTK